MAISEPSVCVVAEEYGDIIVFIRRRYGARWYDSRLMEYVRIHRDNPAWWVEMRINRAKKRFEGVLAYEARPPTPRQLRKQARIDAALDQFECKGS